MLWTHLNREITGLKWGLRRLKSASKEFDEAVENHKENPKGEDMLKGMNSGLEIAKSIKDRIIGEAKG